MDIFDKCKEYGRSNLARCFKNAIDMEIAFGRLRGSDSDGLVRHANVQCRAVRLRVNSDGGNFHLAARPKDAHRNFTAVGNEDFLKHALFRMFGWDPPSRSSCGPCAEDRQRSPSISARWSWR